MQFLSKKRFEFMKKLRSKQRGERITYAKLAVDLTQRYELDKDIPDDFMDAYLRKRPKPISERRLNMIAEYFDCHPGYLVGLINEKAEKVSPLLFGRDESEVLSHFADISGDIHQQYTDLKKLFLIDDEGYYVPSWDQYLYEKKRMQNEQNFKQWLLAIPNFHNQDFLEGIPTEKELQNIIACMTDLQLQIFQGKMIEAVEDYLKDNGYINDMNEKERKQDAEEN